MLRGWKADVAAFDLGQLAFQVADLYKVTIDPGLDLLHLALVLARAGLSAHICLSEGVDVACILTNDQVVKVLVIEAFAFAGDGASHFVVVQVDVHLLACSVEE